MGDFQGGVSSFSSNSAFRYNICNGLSNQLLAHASSIAYAIDQGYSTVQVPDAFIVQGAQEEEEEFSKERVAKVVLPTLKNAVAFGVAFDREYFVTELRKQFGLQIDFVSSEKNIIDNIQCVSFLEMLRQVQPELVQRVLQVFRPSEPLQDIIDRMQTQLEQILGRSSLTGVCLHHRTGNDWKQHCNRWSQIPDGTYRGNCDLVVNTDTDDEYDEAEKEVSSSSSLDALEDALLYRSQGSPSGKPDFVYLCTDDDDEDKISEYRQMEDALNMDIVSHHSLLTPQDKGVLQSLFPTSLDFSAVSARDLSAWIDFNMCSRLSTFVGNSVSTFSALQIALRESQDSFWYNSQGVPLSDVWKVYQMPIVYTYTEASELSGKLMLQTSIASVRHHMPHNPIHILYHGSSDRDFQDWLVTQNNVILHPHNPTWQDAIEQMRLMGNAETSHLFAHPGNYLGTWQRIDVPLFVNSEYALVLDADTFLTKPFTMADFGMDVTRTLAMSSEVDLTNVPVNAGVMLLNIPFMRESYEEFMEFITNHVHSPHFNNAAPSDQGAYLEFYEDDATFLSRCFNFKPYYHLQDIECEEPFIVHFHGAKPHDYLKRIMGQECNPAIRNMCNDALHMPSLCSSLQIFAKGSQHAIAQEGREDLKGTDKHAMSASYCDIVFPNSQDAYVCNGIFDALVEQKEPCTDLSAIVLSTLDSLELFPEMAETHAAMLRTLSEQTTRMRMLNAVSEVPSVAPSSAPTLLTTCIPSKGKCVSGLKCCSKKQKCYGKKTNKEKCAKCAKKKQNCKKAKDCCNYKKGYTCDKKKKVCVKCDIKGKKCKKGTQCCSGKCQKKGKEQVCK